MTQQLLFNGLRMQAYVGQTRSADLIAQLAAAGVGECVTRGQLPPRRTPWFYDNGAFEDFQAGRPFNALQFTRDLRAIVRWCDVRGFGIGRGRSEGQPMRLPDFLVLPDLVGQGEASLAFSLDWLQHYKQHELRWYLAVQDGMTASQVGNALGSNPYIRGLFVGGTLEWKLRTAPQWCAFARELGRPIHIGRVGTVDRVKWAASIGATSIDSALPLWTRSRLADFLREVA